MKVFNSTLKLLIFLLLASCGGGGGGSITTGGNSPPLSRVANQSVSNNLVQNLATGDLNGDGLDDVVIGGWNSDAPTATISILIQNSDGTLTDKTSTLLPGSNVYGGSQHSFIADFNNDGKNDIFLPGFGDGVQEYPRNGVVLWNTGSGFTRSNLPEQTMSHGACVDDINGDGFLDVLVAGGYSGSVGGIYINNGNQTFTLNQNALVSVTGSNFFSACSVIHENNGNIDILFGNTGNVNGYRNNIVVFDSNLNVLSNTGLNQMDGNGHSLTGGDLIDSIAIDVNGDGHKDFVPIYNMIGANGTPAFAGDIAAKRILLWTSAGQYTYSTTIDNNYENLYFAFQTSIGGIPSVFFGGSNDQAVLYQVINGSFVGYKNQRFTDMAIQAGIPNPTQINFAIDSSVIYQNTSTQSVFMLQLLNGVWYTQKM